MKRIGRTKETNEMKKVDWDYTDLAATYSLRPQYADESIDTLIAAAGLSAGDPVVDLGAGTGHLTLKLADRKLDVTAVEPNRNMRAIGISRTAAYDNVRWREAVMQETGLPSGSFALVSYGSCFGIADYAETLAEAHRLLRPGGFLIALFNHRDLDDPLQREIEETIQRQVPGYQYGNRRVEQAPLIESSGHFTGVRRFENSFHHQQSRQTWLDAWTSHATLQRQAGERFHDIVAQIFDLVNSRCTETMNIPYTTRAWIGQRV